MITDKFAGHTPGPLEAARRLKYERDVLQRICARRADALELSGLHADCTLDDARFIASERERLHASNQRLEIEAIQRQGESDRVRLAAKSETETLRNRVAYLEELTTDAYLQSQLGGGYP